MIAQQMQAQLQRMSDQALQQVMANPSNGVPQLYILAELNRRARLRNSAQGAGIDDTTVREALSHPVDDQGVVHFSGGSRDPVRKPFWEYGGDYQVPTYNADAPLNSVMGVGTLPTFAPSKADLQAQKNNRSEPVQQRTLNPALWAIDKAAKGTLAIVQKAFEPLKKQPVKQPQPMLADITEATRMVKPTSETGAGYDAKTMAMLNDMYQQVGYNPVRLETVNENVPDAFKFADRTDETRAGITKDREALANQKKRDWNQTLMQAGIAMAGGRSNNFMENAARGMQAGLDTYSASGRERKAQDVALTAQERGLGALQEQTAYKNDVGNRTVLAQRANIARDNAQIRNQAAIHNADKQAQISMFNIKQAGDKAMMQLRMQAKGGSGAHPGMAAAAKVLIADYSKRANTIESAGGTPEERDAAKTAMYSQFMQEFNALQSQFDRGQADHHLGTDYNTNYYPD